MQSLIFFIIVDKIKKQAYNVHMHIMIGVKICQDLENQEL